MITLISWHNWAIAVPLWYYDFCSPLQGRTHLTILHPSYCHAQHSAHNLLSFLLNFCSSENQLFAYIPLPTPSPHPSIIYFFPIHERLSAWLRLPPSPLLSPSWVTLTQTWVTHHLGIQFFECLLFCVFSFATLMPTTKSHLGQELHHINNTNSMKC